MSRPVAGAVRVVLAVLLGACAGCAGGSGVVPEALDAQVDKSLSFVHLAASPDSYQSKLVLVGGEILNAKRLAEGTQLEILQLPLDEDQQPVPRRSESQGRFLAMDPSGRDPATIEAGARVTVVGEVTGATVGRVDESEYRYPTLTVKHLHVWEDRPVQRGPYVSPWWGFGFGMGSGGRTGGGISIGTGW